MFIVMHDGTLGERAVPDGRGGVVLAQPGVPFEVDDAVAGSAPGPWEPCTSDVPRGPEGEDLAGTHAFAPLDPPVEVDGALCGWQRRHLGSGLLAQEDVFAAAAAPDGGDEL